MAESNPPASTHADTLRALGRYLDSVGGTGIAITEQGEELHVVWKGRGGTQHAHRFGADELQALRTTARLYRGLEATAPRFTAAELLRMVGMILDESGGAASAITETVYGFEITIQVEGGHEMRTYTYSDLVARAQTFHRRQQ
jgi:hypothetical protein